MLYYPQVIFVTVLCCMTHLTHSIFGTPEVGPLLICVIYLFDKMTKNYNNFSGTIIHRLDAQEWEFHICSICVFYFTLIFLMITRWTC